MSEWTPIVVKLDKIGRHPDADTLEISTVLGGYTCIFKEGRFKQGDLAAFIPVDTLVSDNPEFDYLGAKKRIKPAKLRGIFSLGVLAPAPPDAKEGDSVVDYYGLQKYVYDEEKPELGTENEHSPPGYVIPNYDLKSLRRYNRLFNDNEEVVVTEKIDGCNACFMHDGKRLWVKSHFSFKKEDPNNQWWAAADRYELRDRLARFPGLAFFAELYGQVRGFPYDTEIVKNQRQFKLRFFDVMDAKKITYSNWDDVVKMTESVGLEVSPVIYRGAWDKDTIWKMSDGKSLIGDHIREGIVARSATERVDSHVGRVILKLKGETYLLKKK